MLLLTLIIHVIHDFMRALWKVSTKIGRSKGCAWNLEEERVSIPGTSLNPRVRWPEDFRVLGDER